MGIDFVHSHMGRKATLLRTQAGAQEFANRGAGEILLTSWIIDGTKVAFANEILAEISRCYLFSVNASWWC